MKQSARFAMRNGIHDTPAQVYAISVREMYFLREPSFIVFTMHGAAHSVAVGTRHCFVY